MIAYLSILTVSKLMLDAWNLSSAMKDKKEILFTVYYIMASCLTYTLVHLAYKLYYTKNLTHAEAINLILMQKFPALG